MKSLIVGAVLGASVLSIITAPSLWNPAPTHVPMAFLHQPSKMTWLQLPDNCSRAAVDLDDPDHPWCIARTYTTTKQERLTK